MVDGNILEGGTVVLLGVGMIGYGAIKFFSGSFHVLLKALITLMLIGSIYKIIGVTGMMI